LSKRTARRKQIGLGPRGTSAGGTDALTWGDGGGAECRRGKKPQNPRSSSRSRRNQKGAKKITSMAWRQEKRRNPQGTRGSTVRRNFVEAQAGRGRLDGWNSKDSESRESTREGKKSSPKGGRIKKDRRESEELADLSKKPLGKGGNLSTEASRSFAWCEETA